MTCACLANCYQNDWDDFFILLTGLLIISICKLYEVLVPLQDIDISYKNISILHINKQDLKITSSYGKELNRCLVTPFSKKDSFKYTNDLILGPYATT